MWDPGYGALATGSLRIATWNVWGRYGPWAERQPLLRTALVEAAPDIVCLQEAWADDTASQPADLAAALGHTFVYAPGFQIDGAWSGNAILSRWPIARHEVVTLPMEGGGAVDTDVDERRLTVFAEIDGPGGPVQVFCTHLSWRADWSGVRQAQVRALCEHVASTRPRSFPPVVCGDLNAPPDSDELRMLKGLAAVPVRGVVFRDAWAVAGGDAPGATISARNVFSAATLEPDTRIDYILVGWPRLHGVGQVLSARVLGDEAVGGLHGSDHFGVVADLRY